ncbi:efflux transporter periplasmic adaptor subunit [Endozoicomonas sp. OPT23]|uniref:efflux RND transporter periplasmic adaptor subunit n=1 Tax=Endozoicomonas sp. OPT23 TaxID=2072845 RepID=UPI00129BAF0C|nr:efflux RND transporter periplasmic adaptor subunit [Endozoicomonas sp. OPT23]MRI33673.1 efflux transporter periplasmic adaptor subunit [Endozoicomonas sp. OPT23]
MAKQNGLRQLVVSTVVLAICGGLAFGLSNWSQPPKKKAKSTPFPLVQTQVLEQKPVSFTVDSQGVVQPAIETSLVAEVTGVITDVAPGFASGRLFKKGELLARIDDSDYRVGLKQAEATLAAKKAKLQEEMARSEAEKKSWLRAGRKLADAPPLLLRLPYVNEAKANVQAAEAQLEKARRDLERTRVRAPYDGMVKDREINLGQYIAKGAVVGSVFSINSAEVRLPLKPADLMFVRLPEAGKVIEQTIPVTFTQQLGSQSVTWQGQLDRIEGVVDQQSRMHFVVATISDPYGLQSDAAKLPLKAGSFVRASITGGELDNLIRVPRNVVYGDGQVLLVNNDSSVTFRKVTSVYADEDSVYISEGLKEGDVLCLTPLVSPVEGMRIRVDSESSLVNTNKTSAAKG